MYDSLMIARRTTRKIITRAIVFIIAGAIVNVAVAWGCALFPQIQRASNTEWLSKVEHASDWSACGVTLHETLTEFGYGNRFILASQTSIMAGWPSYSLQGSVANHPVTVGTPFTSVMSDSTVDRVIFIRIPGSARDIAPTGPLWPGFAINTIFYAAILWLLLATPGFVRKGRRIKRGLCPACAYPIGASNVCTECGAPVKTTTPFSPGPAEDR